jgi:Zn-dependent protease with chaperone function
LAILRRILLLALCFTLTIVVRADSIETKIEKTIGKEVSFALRASQGVDEDPLLAAWVSRVGATVSQASPRQDVPYTFTILGSDVANALAAPGGSIFVTRGLLDTIESDDELAAILAHETGHVAKHHAMQQIKENALFVALLLAVGDDQNKNLVKAAIFVNILRTLQKSREMEAQADEVGLKYAYLAGYDSGGLVHFFDGFDLRHRSQLEQYFATHPEPVKRLADARKSPYVQLVDPAMRDAEARGFEERGLSRAARVVRRGGDPLVPPPLPPPAPLTRDLADQRKQIYDAAESIRKGLGPTYRTQQFGNILQTILLVNGQTDLRWLYIAAHAYAVQARVDDIFARTLRVARAAPATYDALVDYAGRPADDPAAVESSLGRVEVQRALARVKGADTPIRRAATAVATVLVDLNNRFYRPRGDATWLRYGALEGLLQYAESELARADKMSGQGWRILSVARVRRYQLRLNDLVPEADASRRAQWYDLASRRLGVTFPNDGPTGDATVRAALALEVGAAPAELAGQRGNTPWANFILDKKGVPENVATVMRLLTLDLERETADEDKQQGQGKTD